MEELANREAVGPDGSAAAIETRGLVAGYGRREAVRGLDLAVPHGSVYGFLGPNGAGRRRP